MESWIRNIFFLMLKKKGELSVDGFYINVKVTKSWYLSGIKL